MGSRSAPLFFVALVLLTTTRYHVALELHTEAEYPCIKQTSKPDTIMLPASKVCDGNKDCQYADDEYFCVEVGDVETNLNDIFGEPGDLPCCKVIPCLNCRDEHCYINTESFNEGYWDECTFHEEYEEDFQCVNSTQMSTTQNLEKCPWNCICCPLMILCYGASWPQFQMVMTNMTSYARVRVLRFDAFHQIPEDLTVRLSMWQAMAKAFPYLRHLAITDTRLTELTAAEFASFRNLYLLRLNGIGIQHLEKDHFIGLQNLTVLGLENNSIVDISHGPFTQLTHLTELSLYRNPLTSLNGSAWDGLNNITVLRLDRTNITRITNSSFRSLPELQALYMKISSLRVIDPGSFNVTPKLTYLYFTDNQLQMIQKGTFDGPKRLQEIAIDKSPVEYIEEGAFRNQSTVYLIGLNRMPNLKLNRKMLQGLDNKTLFLATDVPGICCLVKQELSQASQKCKVKPLTLDFTTCGALLPNVLKIFLWIMAFAAIIGNVMVICQRCRRHGESSSQNVQRILILHLAFADLLMGIYLLMIGVSNAQYGEDYFWYTEIWRHTDMCKAAGFLALLSSEASLFIIAAISIDRFLILVFPFSHCRLRGKPLLITVGAIWCVSILLSAVGIPRSTGEQDSAFGQSSVCIALPLVTRYDNTDGVIDFQRDGESVDGNFELQNDTKSPAWTYSIAVFLGINTICLLLVLICYVWIYTSVVKSRKSVKRSANTEEEIRMAIKMAVIVGTDFCCWLPIIIMGIITQSGLTEISSGVYAWVIVFVLPINSSINPYLYTLNGSLDHINKYRSRRRGTTGASSVTYRLTRMFSRDTNGNGGAAGHQMSSRHGVRGLATEVTTTPKSSPLSIRQKGNNNSENNVKYTAVNNI